MRAKLVRRVTVLSFCLVACLAVDAAGQSAMTETVPFTLLVVGCNEAVATEGVVHVSARSDGTHVTTHASMVGMEGVGVPSGDKYNFHLNDEQSSTSNGSQFEATVESWFHVIRLNSASGEAMDDFFFTIRTHVTRNANGQPTANFERFEAICR